MQLNMDFQPFFPITYNIFKLFCVSVHANLYSTVLYTDCNRKHHIEYLNNAHKFQFMLRRLVEMSMCTFRHPDRRTENLKL